MNERIIKELQLAAMHSVWDGHDPDGDVDKMYIPAEFTKKFAELIVRECMAQCEQVAAEADSVTQSEFVTDAGRMLHEGMWGGAKNCSGQIQTHFGVEE